MNDKENKNNEPEISENDEIIKKIDLPEDIDAVPVEVDAEKSINVDAENAENQTGEAYDLTEENAEDAYDTDGYDDDFADESYGENDIPEEADDLNEDDEEADGGNIEAENNENSDEGIKDADEEKKPRNFKKILKPFLIAAAAAAAVFVVVYAAEIFTLPKDTIMHNTYIENTAVGGKTYDEAAALIKDTALLNNQIITLTSEGETFTINGSDIGITPNLESTVKNAFNYGKSGNIFVNGFLNLKSLFVKNVIIPVAAIDAEALTEKINEFGIELKGEMTGHYIEINSDDCTATVWPGHSGYNPNDENSYAAAVKTVTEHLENSSYYNIPVEFPVSSPQELSMEAFDAAVYKDPTDAYYKVENNEISIVPEETGRYINKEEAAPLLLNVFEGGEAVKIPYYISYAEKTSEDLGTKLFNATIGSYSTSYSSSDGNRKANVARAASLINGKILAPGEIFSFNDTVGDRSVENGFYTAKEYVNGESVDGIGGGTCQVSTTLYSAVLYADLGIVSRTNHDMTVGYVPLGQDATVAYGSIDFKFKNTTDYPVKISASADGSELYVSIIGTEWDPPRKVDIKHTTSTSGTNTIVNSTRYVYQNGELISTDSLGQSCYKPHKTDN